MAGVGVPCVNGQGQQTGLELTLVHANKKCLGWDGHFQRDALANHALDTPRNAFN